MRANHRNAFLKRRSNNPVSLDDVVISRREIEDFANDNNFHKFKVFAAAQFAQLKVKDMVQKAMRVRQ